MSSISSYGVPKKQNNDTTTKNTVKSSISSYGVPKETELPKTSAPVVSPTATIPTPSPEVLSAVNSTPAPKKSIFDFIAEKSMKINDKIGDIGEEIYLEAGRAAASTPSAILSSIKSAGNIGLGIATQPVQGALDKIEMIAPKNKAVQDLNQRFSKITDTVKEIKDKPIDFIKEYTDKWKNNVSSEIDYYNKGINIYGEKFAEPDKKDFLEKGVGALSGTIVYMLPAFLSGGSATSASIIGGMTEAGADSDQVFDDLISQGKSVKEASNKRDIQFVTSGVVNSLSDKFGIFGETSSLLKRILNTELAEVPAEVLTQFSSNILTNKKAGEGLVETALITAFISPILGAFGHGVSENEDFDKEVADKLEQNPAFKEMTPEQQQNVAETITNIVETARTEKPQISTEQPQDIAEIDPTQFGDSLAEILQSVGIEPEMSMEVDETTPTAEVITEKVETPQSTTKEAKMPVGNETKVTVNGESVIPSTEKIDSDSNLVSYSMMDDIGGGQNPVSTMKKSLLNKGVDPFDVADIISRVPKVDGMSYTDNLFDAITAHNDDVKNRNKTTKETETPVTETKQPVEGENDLISEAKKYKSADEFVASKRTAESNTKVFEDLAKENFDKLNSGEISVFKNERSGKWNYDIGNGQISSSFFNTKAKTIELANRERAKALEYLKNNFVKDNTENLNKVLPTKSQLTDIWNKANKQESIKERNVPDTSIKITEDIYNGETEQNAGNYFDYKGSAFSLFENEGEWKAVATMYKNRAIANWAYNFLDKKQKKEYDNIRDKMNFGTKADAEKLLKELQEFENKNKEVFTSAKNAIDYIDNAETESELETDRVVSPTKTFYHGTYSDFDTFTLDNAGSNTSWDNAKFGIFFSDNKGAVQQFLDENRDSDVTGEPKIKEVNLDIKNPLDLTIHGIFSNKEQAPFLVKLLGGEDMTPDEALEYLDENVDLGSLSEFFEGIYSDIDNKKIMESAGYDGIVASFGKDDNNETIHEYVAFNPSQIKEIKKTGTQKEKVASAVADKAKTIKEISDEQKTITQKDKEKLREVFMELRKTETGGDKHGNNAYVTLSGSKYHVGKMSYDEWYLEPYVGKDRKETDDFSENTLWEKSDTAELIDLFKENGLYDKKVIENTVDNTSIDLENVKFEYDNTEFNKRELKKNGFGVEALGFEDYADILKINGEPAIAMSMMDDAIGGFSVAEKFRGQGIATKYFADTLKEQNGTLEVVDPNEAMLAVLNKVGNVSKPNGEGIVTVTERKPVSKDAQEFLDIAEMKDDEIQIEPIKETEEIETPVITSSGETTDSNVVYEKFTKVGFYDYNQGRLLTGRLRYPVFKGEDYASVMVNEETLVGGIPIGRIDRVPLKDLTYLDAPSNIVNNEQGTNTNDTDGDREQLEGLSDVIDVPTRDADTDSGEFDDSISGYDNAVNLVEPGNGLSTDRPDERAVEPNTLSKKDRQLINEQVELLLIEKNYSKNPDAYTQEEVDLMANYTGSGGKESVGATGKGLLNEYYTPIPLVEKLWDIVQKIAPNSTTAFEPSAGTGRIIKNSPVSITVDGAELSQVSGTIAQILNPDSKITIGDFQEIFFDKKTGKEKNNIPQYDVVIGNPPFGERSGFIKGKGEESKINRQEEYFIKRGLDMTNNGGTLAYIVNSSFLTKGSSEGKRLIASLGTLVKAYRLPENSFEDTSIGTDIVVFKKEPTLDASVIVDRMLAMSDEQYFIQNESDVLGVREMRKNRFGQLETYIKGNLDSALNAINVDEITTPTIENAKVEMETKPEPVEVVAVESDQKGGEKKVRKTVVRKRNESKEVTAQVLPAEIDYADKVTPVQNTSKQDSIYNQIEVDMLKRIERDGSIPNPTPQEMPFLNYTGGKFYNDGLYFSGEIYKKLGQLQMDKQYVIDNFGQKQYDKQKNGLTDVIPTPVTIKDIAFDPLDRHLVMKMVNNDKGEQTILLNVFTDYLRQGGYSLTGKTSKYEVIAYVTGERLPNGSIIRMPQIVDDSKRLFNAFIKQNLDPDVQELITKEYNEQKNGFVIPNYSMIPVEIQDMSKKFKGKDFKLSRVQANGISFLVNKGTGLIMYGVGVGKTHTMLTATVANMQKGWTNRPLFIVPDATLRETWIGTIRAMFPGITINNLSGLQAPIIKKLKAEKGDNVADWIKDGEISIITHTGILKLGFTEEQINDLTKDLTDALWVEPKTKRGGEGTQGIIDEIAGRAQKYATDVMIDDLGIDHISVDEVHNFRKIFMGAKVEKDIPGEKKRFGNVEGSGTAAIRAQQLFLIAQHIQKNNNNRNVFLASATPFENKATEVYNILSLIARDRMKEMGILNINDFYSAFSDFRLEQDVKLDGSVVTTSKFKNFSNLQSLRKLLLEFFDVQEDKTLVRPDRKVMTPHLQMSDKQKENQVKIQELLSGESFDDQGNVSINEKVPGAMIKATTYTVANSLSPWFIKEYVGDQKPTAEQLVNDSPKIKFTLEAIRKIKNNPKTKDYGNLMFLDIYGVGYHPMIADYFAKELGYKPEQVAVLSGNSITAEQKEQIKKDFNSGKIKFLIGGDQAKEGIDLQDNGFAMFDLALGWNPSKIVQKSGRIWRPGNKRNIALMIYPLVENSGDSFIYNKFDEKGSRINDMFHSTGAVFDVGEIDPAEKKLALITDPKTRANMQIAIEQANIDSQKVGVETEMKDFEKMKIDLKNSQENIPYYQELLDKYKDKDKKELSTWEKDRIATYKKEIKSSEEQIKRITKKLEIAGVTSIDSKIDELKQEVDQIDELIKKLNETYEEKLKKFTEMRKEEIKNQKSVEQHVQEIDEILNTVKERTDAEIQQIKAGLIQKLKDAGEYSEMADFIVAPRKQMETYIKSHKELERRQENARKLLGKEKETGKQAILNGLSQNLSRGYSAYVKLKNARTEGLSSGEIAELERQADLNVNRAEYQTISYFLDMMPEELFDDVALQIQRNGGANGLYHYNSSLISMFLRNIRNNNATIDRVFVHEMWHHLSKYIPASDVARVKNDYEKATASYLKANPWFKYHIGNDNTINKTQYDKLVEQYPEAENNFTLDLYSTISNPKYKAGYTEENYRFKNLDEWVAETMADYSLDRLNEMSVESTSIMLHLKTAFRLFLESVQRFFGFNNSSRLFKDFVEGRNMFVENNRKLFNGKNVSAYHDPLFDAPLNNLMVEQEQISNEIDTIADKYSINLLKKDINSFVDLTASAKDIYLSDPKAFSQADTITKISEARTQKKNLFDVKMSKILEPYSKLEKSYRTLVNKVLMDGDENAIVYTDGQLQEFGLSQPQIEAYRAVRKSFDTAFDVLIAEMERNGVNEEEIETFKREREGYMPHKWKYPYAIKIQKLKDGADPRESDSWITESIDVYKTEKESLKKFNELVKENKDTTGTRYIQDKFESLDVDFFTQQRFSFENLKSVIGQAKVSQELKDTMIEGVRDIMKAKGFGRNFIRRTGVQGYEKNDVENIITEYMTGFSGFITKMEAGKKYFDVLGTINATKQKKFYNAMRDLIAYDMASNTDGGKVTHALKTASFIYSLANDMSFLLTNLTQNYTVGIGELSKLFEGSDKIVKPEIVMTKAMIDVATGNLSQGEKDVIKGLLLIGELGGDQTSELTGFKNNAIYSAFSKGLNTFLFKATSFSEQINRVSSFLAARRTLIAKGYDETQANEQALEISRDIHFRYGKIYRPKFMRGGISNIVFTYYQYIRSMLYSIKEDVTKKEFTSISKKMFYTMLLGGTASLPFAKLIKMAYESLIGGGDDDDKEEMSKWELALNKGIPATFGVDMSDRVALDLMSLNKLAEDINSKDPVQAAADMRNYWGAIGDLIFGRLYKGVKMTAEGRYLEGSSKLLPDMLGNPLRAIQGAKYGVFTSTGTPLADPTTGKILEYTPTEAIIKGIGFTPTREALAWDAKNKEWKLKNQRSEIKDKALTSAINDWKNVPDKTVEKKYQMVDSVVEKVYGKNPTKAQTSLMRKEVDMRIVFGFNNTWANRIHDAGTNDEKVELLRQAKKHLSPDEFATFFNNGRKTTTYVSGDTSPILISNDVYQDYIKK